MRKHTRQRILVAVVCGLIASTALSQGRAAPADPSPSGTINYLSIRLAQAPSDELLTALAEVARSVDQAVPATAQPEDVIAQFCGGSYTKNYFAQVRKLNPNFQLVKSPNARTISLPPCAIAEHRVRVKVAAGQDLGSILKQQMGLSKDALVNICADQKDRKGCVVQIGTFVAKINGGPSFNPDNLKAGQTITLPFATHWTSIALRPDQDPQQAITRIKSAVAHSLAPAVAITPALSLQKPLTGTDKWVEGTACADDMPIPSNWPFAAKDLQDALVQARPLAEKRMGHPISPTVVRIGDTGAYVPGTFLPDNALAINPDAQQTTTPRDGIGRYGISADLTGNVAPTNTDPDRWHGTEIADLALGGQAFRTAFPGIYDYIRLNFAKLFRPTDNSVDASMLSSSVSRAPPQPFLINFSVAGSQPIPTFRDTMLAYRNPGVLVVVAAGNQNDNLTTTDIFPASYGGNNSAIGDEMMVVGAYGPDGSMTEFSNYGAVTVDILAPGCLLKFNPPAVDGQPPGATVILDGTSASAPFVTFTAAILHALGIDSPGEIKKHIIASADYDRLLGRLVISGSKLNISRSVRSLFDDILVTTTGDEIAGTWNNDALKTVCKGEDTAPPMDFTRVLKVDVFVENGARRLSVLQDQHENGYLRLDPCTPDGDGITFQTSDGKTTEWPWSKIQAIVLHKWNKPQ